MDLDDGPVEVRNGNQSIGKMVFCLLLNYSSGELYFTNVLLICKQMETMFPNCIYLIHLEENLPKQGSWFRQCKFRNLFITC